MDNNDVYNDAISGNLSKIDEYNKKLEQIDYSKNDYNLNVKDISKKLMRLQSLNIEIDYAKNQGLFPQVAMIVKNNDIPKKRDEFTPITIQKHESTLVCPNCNGTDILMEENDVICSKCNVIITSNYYEDTIPDNNILIRKKVVFDHKVGKEILDMSQHEKSLAQVYEYIENLCDNLGLSKAISTSACQVYNKMMAYNVSFRSGNKIGLICAGIKITSEINDCPRSIQEILEFVPDITRKKFTKGLKKINWIIRNSNDPFFNMPCKFDVEEKFIERYSLELGLNNEQIQEILTIYRNCEKMKMIHNHNSQSKAAAIMKMYIKKNELNINHHIIYNLYGISENTINKVEKHLENLYDLFTSDYLTEFVMNKLSDTNTNK